ncbi:MAG: MPT63 family protein [Mycolicibacterium cosmeticum]|nr:MPT63 family protein [Mycolicibacterium cosmeticum]
MNLTKRTLAAVAVATLFGAVAVAPASAIDNIKPFGQQETIDSGGSAIGYTVAGLKPSSDAIPYPVAGQLYEATVTVDAVRGAVSPVIPFFNARAEDGATYRVLSNIFTPQGLSGGTVLPGDSSRGKLYFDVVGPPPNSVVYNNGDHDLLGWVRVDGAPDMVSPVDPGSTSELAPLPAENDVQGSTGPDFNSPNMTAPSQNGLDEITAIEGPNVGTHSEGGHH